MKKFQSLTHYFVAAIARSTFARSLKFFPNPQLLVGKKCQQQTEFFLDGTH